MGAERDTNCDETNKYLNYLKLLISSFLLENQISINRAVLLIDSINRNSEKSVY